jgi:hypothetical protein
VVAALCQDIPNQSAGVAAADVAGAFDTANVITVGVGLVFFGEHLSVSPVGGLVLSSQASEPSASGDCSDRL